MINHGCPNAAQHGIISLLLLLLLHSGLPTIGAESGRNAPPPNHYPYAKFSAPMAIVIGVLVAALFLLGFFSVYIRQCFNTPAAGAAAFRPANSLRLRRPAARGLDPAVIETFPTFAYSDVKGLKIGKGALECAVCLNEFEDDETLRLIPNCDHVFHPECIDEWLSAHVTCPVCRSNLSPPKPGENPGIPAEEPEAVMEIADSENDAVPADDHVAIDVQGMSRNQSLNRNRPARSGSVKSVLSGKLPRSHTTGHSPVQPGENTERFTLRLPEEVRKRVMNRTTSCVVVLPREGSSRRGSRTGVEEKSGRGLFTWRSEKMERSSFKRGDSEIGTSSTTPKGTKTAIKLPSFRCLEAKDEDETALVREADSARQPV